MAPEHEPKVTILHEESAETDDEPRDRLFQLLHGELSRQRTDALRRGISSDLFENSVRQRSERLREKSPE